MKFKPKTDPKIKALRDERAKLLRDRRILIAHLRSILAKTAINTADLIQAGHIPLKRLQHPLYISAIEPLLMEARRMCLFAGFDFIYQTRTPLTGEPDMTEGLVGVHEEATSTMQACIDLIQARPAINRPIKQPGEHSPAAQPQLDASDNDSSQKASE